MKKISLLFIGTLFTSIVMAQSIHDKSLDLNNISSNSPIHENPIFQELSSKNKLNKKDNIFQKKTKNTFWVCDTVTSYDVLNIELNRKIYTFDASGNCITELLQSWINNEWTNFIKFTYTYNDNDSLLTRLTENWANNVWNATYRVTNTYNPDGTLQFGVGENWYDSRWNNYGRRVYTFGENGLISSTIDASWYANFWEDNVRFYYEYDQNKNLILSIMDTWNNNSWSLSNKTSYTYNSGNTLIMAIYESSNDGTSYTLINKATYSYDEVNNNTVCLFENRQNNNWIFYQKSTSSYSPNGEMLSYLRENWELNEWVSYSKDSYTYDNYGNSITGKKEQWSENSWKPYFWNYGTPFYCNYKQNSFTQLNNTYRFEANFKSFTNTNKIEDYSIKTALYPNPAKDHITIESTNLSKDATIIIYDSFGRMAKKQSAFETVSVKELSKGFYLYHIYSNGQVSIGKLIVE